MTLDEMIDEAAKLPPGPAALEPIFKAFPELTPEELAAKFRSSADRAFQEAAELRRYLAERAASR
jgi:hypothetical protein